MKKNTFLAVSAILIVAIIVMISSLTSLIENIGVENITAPLVLLVLTLLICYIILKNKKYIQFLNKIPEKDVKL